MMPCPRNHPLSARYRDADGSLDCRECRRLRRAGLLPPKLDVMVRYCRNGHGPANRKVSHTGKVGCRQCERVAGIRRNEQRRGQPTGSDAHRRRRLRADALRALGGQCVCCGQDREVFLQFDHINNDGAEHRRRTGGNTPRKVCREIRADPVAAAMRYQILCANCNWAKWVEKDHTCAPVVVPDATPGGACEVTPPPGLAAIGGRVAGVRRAAGAAPGDPAMTAPRPEPPNPAPAGYRWEVADAMAEPPRPPAPYYADDTVTLHRGDALEVLRTLPAGSVHCVVTSPPYYGLRDYGTGQWSGGDRGCDHGAARRERRQSARQAGLNGGTPGSLRDAPAICCPCGAVLTDRQCGLEPTPGAYVDTIRRVFAEVRRVLSADGTLWLNLGDGYVSNGGAAGRLAATGLQGTHPRTRPEADDPHTFGRWNRDWDLPQKNLLGMPWRVAFALQADGWIMRNAVVWAKPNAMPESVTDRLSCRYEMVFLLARSRRYWFDLDAIREPLGHPDALDGTCVFGGRHKGGDGGVGANARRRGHNVYGGGKHGRDEDTPPGTKPQTNKGATGERHTMTHEQGRNPGDVWSLPTQPFPEAHFAVMPPDLARRCILAGCRPGGVVLDPFCGSGTTGMVAQQLGRRFVGIDLSAKYLDLALRTRLAQGALVEEVGDRG